MTILLLRGVLGFKSRCVWLFLNTKIQYPSLRKASVHDDSVGFGFYVNDSWSKAISLISKCPNFRMPGFPLYNGQSSIVNYHPSSNIPILQKPLVAIG